MNRPAFTLRHVPQTMLLAFAGAFVGMVLTGALLVFFDFGWMLVVLLLPVFLVHLLGQALVEGTIFAAMAGWRKLRNTPAEPEPAAAPDAPLPWGVEYAFSGGMIFAFLVIMALSLSGGGP